MALTYDPAKRAKTLAERGLDFADAEELLNGPVFEFVDARFDYGEARITSIGLLRGRMLVLVWTRRGDDKHIISMRKANAREQARYQSRLG